LDIITKKINRRGYKLIQKIDVTDLLLDPPERNNISPKTIRFLLFLFVGLLSYFLLSLISTEKKENINILKKEGKIQVSKTDNLKQKKEKIQVSKTESLRQKPIITKSTRYIQVSAFSNESNDDQLLRKIKRNKLNYKIVKGEKFTRILIGPYKNYDTALKEIITIKEKIKKDSFITSKFK
jgi:hypothetical protein